MATSRGLCLKVLRNFSPRMIYNMRSVSTMPCSAAQHKSPISGPSAKLNPQVHKKSTPILYQKSFFSTPSEGELQDEGQLEIKKSWTAPIRDEYLLRKKYDLIFSTYDINNDGLFSWDDAEEYIMRLEQIRGDAVEDMPHFRELIRSYLGDMIGNLDKGMDRWQFSDSLCKMRTKNAARMVERLSKKAVILWECMDLNKDGQVQADEFQLMFQAMMVDNAHVAKQIFKAIDVNGDNNISKDELRSLYLDYMMNERPDPLSVIYLSSRQQSHRRP